MRIFVTAGNTQVPIDRVRCITNIFTGRTGASIAQEAHRRGHHVVLLTSRPESVPFPAAFDRYTFMVYQTFEDLDALMARSIADWKPDAIVHSAAVSDYLSAGIFAPASSTHFDPKQFTWHDFDGTPTMLDRAAGKVKSDEPELWLRMVRAPKLVDKIRRDWAFRGTVVKFKLEVGVSEEQLLATAEKSRRQSDADWMVANTLESASDWAFIGKADRYVKVPRADLAAAVLDRMEQEGRRG
jgi:phosphopantothenoylcysteine synthetase/decarboxylase